LVEADASLYTDLSPWNGAAGNQPHLYSDGFSADDVNSDQSILSRLPMILFFVTGIFWVGVLATGGGILLGWAIITCFASGVFLFMWTASWVTRPLVAASALFGLVLTGYQFYVALTALGTPVQSVAIISAPLFAVFAVVYIYLLYAGASRPRA
jgi:hypothetical protein